MLVNPKIKLVRKLETLFDDRRLINDIVEKLNNKIPGGRILDYNLGTGFSIELKKPTNLKDMLYPKSSLTSTDNNGVAKIKKLMEDSAKL